MNMVDWIGSIGVFLILSAYFLQVTGRIDASSTWFKWLNLIGASLACFASVMLAYWPFIVLEGAWAMVALFAIIKKPA